MWPDWDHDSKHCLSDSGAVISRPSLMHTHAGKLAQVQDLLRSWSLHFLSLQFSCWQRKNQTLLQERRVGRRTKVIWKIWFLKNGSSFVSICFSLEQDIFHKSYLYLKYYMATWNIIFPLHPLRLSKQPHLKEE